MIVDVAVIVAAPVMVAALVSGIEIVKVIEAVDDQGLSNREHG